MIAASTFTDSPNRTLHLREVLAIVASINFKNQNPILSRQPEPLCWMYVQISPPQCE